MPTSGKDGCDRFIPSATGPLHFGSLVAAVVSYLDARTRVRAGFGGCRRSICRTMCWAGLFAQVYCRFGRRRRQLMVGWFITVLVLPPGRTPHAWRLRCWEFLDLSGFVAHELSAFSAGIGKRRRA